MTEEPSQPSGDPAPSEAPGDAVKESNQESSKPKTETPPGMLPLVDPVFGKRAFLITAVPFLIYLMGTGFGAHLETIRKTAPVHDMKAQCRGEAGVLASGIEDGLPPEQAQSLLERMDMPAVQRAFDDESSDVTKLMQDCEKLLTADFSDLPEKIRVPFEQFQENVRHFFELEAMHEENEIDGIRAVHAEWLANNGAAAANLPKLNQSWYPTLYSIACIGAFIVVLFALPGYLKIPFRISGFAVGVGVAGIFVWLGLWWLDKEFLHIGEFFAPNSRAGFNPWVELAATPTWMYAFVGIRLLGLCLVIPIAEEFFARGFLMRYIEDIDWDQIPVGEATWRGLAGIIGYGAMTHPGEIVAAVAWFSLVTWMYLKTKNIWDCVIAHSVTNILLAVFVLATKTWELW